MEGKRQAGREGERRGNGKGGEGGKEEKGGKVEKAVQALLCALNR